MRGELLDRYRVLWLDRDDALAGLPKKAQRFFS